jgi:hypothetical protein
LYAQQRSIRCFFLHEIRFLFYRVFKKKHSLSVSVIIAYNNCVHSSRNNIVETTSGIEVIKPPEILRPRMFSMGYIFLTLYIYIYK